MRVREIMVVGWLIVIGGFISMAVTDDRDLGEGRWKARPVENGVRLELRAGGLPWQSRTDFTLGFHELAGLSPESLAADAALEFRLVRDAGSIEFEGAGGRRPAGRYRFTPDPEFVGRLSDADVDADDGDLFRLVVHDVSGTLVEQLQQLGYRRIRAHELLRLAVHGVDASYVEGMQVLEERPTFGEIVRLHVHGIDPEQVASYVEAGFPGLSVEQVIRLKVHQMPEPLLRAAALTGRDASDLSQVIRFKTHGIEPDYLGGMHELGLGDTEAVIRLHVHGVPVETVAKLHALGHDDLGVEELVRLRTHGVDPDFVGRAESAVGRRLDVEELVRAKVQGVETLL